MSKQSVTAVSMLVLAVLLFSGGQGLARQEVEPKISRPESDEKPYRRDTLTGKLERGSAFRRLEKGSNPPSLSPSGTNEEIHQADAWEKVYPVASAPSLPAPGTGGDINESEPNQVVAQGVSLPVNIFGKAGFDGDVDYFAF